MINLRPVGLLNAANVAGALLLASLYIGLIREGNTAFPNLLVYGVLTLMVSILLYLPFWFRSNARSSVLLVSDDHSIKLTLGALLAFLIVTWLSQPLFLRWLLLCEGIFLLAWLAHQMTPARAYCLVLAAGVGMRWIANYQIPFGSTSDMLPLVKSGLLAFLDGENPYRAHIITMPFATYPLTMTYLPVTWMSYLPALLLKIDLRWTNVGADIVSAWALWFGMRKPVRNGSYIGALLLGLWCLNPYFSSRMDAEISIFCMVLSLFLYAMATQRFWMLGVITGIMLATVQLALIVVPFAFVYLLIQTGIKRAAGVSTLALAIASVLIVPFYGENMLHGVLLHWQHLYDFDLVWARNTIANLNYAVFFYGLSAQKLLAPIQMLICLAMFWLFVKQRDFTLGTTLRFSAITLLLFLQFNLVVWTYLFLPVFILWAWYLSNSISAEPKIE